MLPKSCLLELRSQTDVGAGAGDDQAAGDRNHQRRDYGHQPVADGEHGVGLERVAQVHVVLQNADQEARDDVDAGDDDAGDGVALREAAMRRPWRRRIRLRCSSSSPAALGFGFIDQSAVEIGIDRHLFAGQGIQT